MRIKLIEVEKSEDITSDFLREIAKTGGKNKYTHYFIAQIEEEEVAFLSLDMEPDHLFIYKIFVLDSYRRKDIGSILIKETEKIAHQKRYNKVVVRPHPIDNLGLEAIRRFYIANGFVSSTLADDLMEKNL